MIKAAIEDVRIALFLVLIIIVVAALFAGFKETATSEEAQQAIEQTEQGFWTSMMILIFGLGIAGVIGLILLIRPLMKGW